MINAIVAFDSQRGIANNQGIPWTLPSDKRYFRAKTDGGLLLMGANNYNEFSAPLPNRINYVVSHKTIALRDGFLLVNNLEDFLSKHRTDNLWIIGGANLYAQTLSKVDELYITRLDGDFHCTKFFPEFEDKFVLLKKSETKTENNIRFRFEVWRSKNPKSN